MKHLQRVISLVLAVLMVFGTAISLAAPEDGNLIDDFNLMNDKLVEVLVEGSLKAELDQAILNPLVKSDLDGASIDLFWQVEEEGIWRNTLDGEVFEEGKDYRLAVNVRDLKIQDKEIEGLRLVSENNSDQVILSIDRGSFSEKEELNFDEKNAKDTNKTETTEIIEETKEEAQESKDQLIFETEEEDPEYKGDDQTDLNTDLPADENQGEENEEVANETIDLLVSDDQSENDSVTQEEPVIIEETTDENSSEEKGSQIVDEKPTEIIDDQKQEEEAEIVEISPEKEADRQASPKAESTVSFIAYSAPMRAGGSGEGVYLNGVNGDDNNDGSKENPVKTFAKAKELSEKNNSDIIVEGTVTINDNRELSLKDGLRVLRGENFNNYLFEITGSNANVTLTNITIDGNYEKNKEIVESLIKVTSGAILNIEKGAVLQNNKNNRIIKETYGGAINTYMASINMNDGIIRNNEAVNGGGIFLSHSKMEFKGGEISSNTAFYFKDTASQHQGTGGGINIYHGSELKMYTGAKVYNNFAAESGGGISVGSQGASDGQNKFYMYGGTIDNNTSGGTGGGIFIQAGLYAYDHGVAYIEAGNITNNKMIGTGKTKYVFGGAGIYVNGIQKNWENGGNVYPGSNGELHLKNAIIKNNTSELEGAGLAVCPISKTKIYITDGAAIYDNYRTTQYNPQVTINDKYDFFLLSDRFFDNGLHAGEPELEISDKMLGSFTYNWKELDGTDADLTNYNGIIRVPDYEQRTIRLYAGNSMPNDAEAALGKVFITGNHSVTRGGGIGSNGTVIIGTDDEKIDVLVEKQWEDGIDPEEVKVEVGIKLDDKNSYVLKTLTLNKENGYQEWIKGLPATIHDKDTKELLYVKELSNKYNVEVSPMTQALNRKLLSFILDRPDTDYENKTPAYTSYFMNHPELGIFDEDTFEFKAFDIKFKLHDLNGNITEREISFDPVSLGFPTTEMTFSNIGLDPNFDKIDIQLYTKEDGSLFENYLLEYDLYLERDPAKEDTLILKVPHIKSTSANPPANIENALEIRKEKMEDVPNTTSYKLIVTNKKKDTPEIEISGTKTWSDFGAENRPEFITVRLFANDVEVAVKEVRASDDWKYDFGKWPAVDGDGKEISYTIKEDPVPGYYTTINGFDIINSREPYEPTPEYVNIRVNKRWIDNDNRNNTRPGSITIELLADGRVVDRATINSANDWGLTFFNMPKYDGGHLIDYTIREVPVEDYRSILTGDMHYGFTLTNELKGEKINIPVRKVWEGKKGAFANVSLYADGEIVYTVSLSDENNWEYIFEDLDRYDANGREIVYTISEASIEGYESRIEGDQDRGFVVTNKSKESPKISIPLKKNWVGKKAEKAIVNLYANGEIVYTVDLSEENAWSFVFEDLDKLDQNGNEIIYSVEEVNIDGYQASLSGSAAEGFVITNTWIPDRPDEDTPGKPNKPKKPELPKTGDGLNKSVYAAMVAIFGGVMVLLGLNEMRRAKRVYEEEKQ
uniref:Cna B-type domain-containing protein n=1 Tax=Ezakiella massiliensis TaxID=1852374 RepID=UPI00094F20AD|nr:Cna B-type domain-containing protein [Ezakiella massiliensis]